MAENGVESTNRVVEHSSDRGGSDPFSEYRIPQFNAPAPGQGGTFVEWQMDRKCSSMLHSMSLTGDFVTSTAKDNPNIVVAPTALSRMTQADINQCAATMPATSYYAKRDANGDVNYIGYRRSAPEFPNPIEHPIATAFFGPGIAFVKAYEGIKHMFKDDASIRIKDGMAIYKTSYWYDVQDGSNQVKVRLAK